MKKITAFLFVFIWCVVIHAQNASPWKKVSPQAALITGKNSAASSGDNTILFQVDEVQLKQLLSTLQNTTIAAKAKGIEMVFPNTNGDFEKFLVYESSNFDPVLQQKYPDIRAYVGKGITDTKATLNFSVSPIGIQTMILRADSGSEFIEKYSEDKSLYVLFSSKNRSRASLPLNCKTEDLRINKELLSKTAKTAANNKVFKTLRLALSCTGEYAQYYGGTVAGALAGMNATMTRVNGVFNKDLAVKLSLIATNNLIIYTNAATDPYSDADKGASGAWSQELQTTLTTTITNSGYDIGHLFGASGGGGNAGCIGCVCDSPTVSDPLAKGSAYTSPGNGNPEGDRFDIDYVAHEMGHQLGANHTFSYVIEDTGVNIEPGSGSTIMGYAGITEDYDVQPSSDDYFSYASIFQIQDNLSTKSCPVSTTFTNATPTVSAGVDYTIPFRTPFILTGSGSDANGDNLTYTWEQIDTAITTSDENSIALPSKADGPLFRSLYPNSSPIRYMPNYINVISNKLTSRWESVSSIARTLHFALTTRDNAALGTAQTNTDEMIVTVSGTVGPFTVTSQNKDNISWFQGQSETITWNVNGTSALPGSSMVTIKLSTDGGLTFPTTLVENTPNDGSEAIVVPDIASKYCRISITPTANIYYAVNSKAFAIGYSASSTCDTYPFLAPFAIPEQAAYTTRTITVPPTMATVAAINFNVGFTHSFLSDVQMEIVSPTGKTVKLFDRSCGDTNGSLLLTYDDSGIDLDCGITTLQTVAPFEALAAFNGDPAQGVWTFRIRDGYRGDTGTLDSASIAICMQSFVLIEPAFKYSKVISSPNPSKGAINIQFKSKNTGGVKVYVYSILGKKIFEKEYESSFNFNQDIQLQDIQSGIYLLTVIDGDRKEVNKIVIE